MKRRSFKTYFLCGVGALAILFAFFALLFSLYELETIKYNGFILMFEYPKGGVFYSILSWTELLVTLVLMWLAICHFWKSDEKRLRKFEKIAVAISLAIGIIYMIEGFALKSDLDDGLFLGSTSGYVPFIFIVLLFILYFASDRFMPENLAPIKKENTSPNKNISQNKEVSQNSENNSSENVDSKKERLEKEMLEKIGKERLDALKQYIELLDKGEITQEEFDKKKALIFFDE